jgi:lipoate-protein ligase B
MQPRPQTLSDTLEVIDLGRDVPYAAGLARQEEAAAARRRGDSATDCLFLLEHTPVYTLGRTADPANILLDDEARAARGIDLVKTARGGDATYHGPGQLVGYPVFKIGMDPRRVLPYVSAVEDAVLRAVARFGVPGARDRRNRGVWVGNAKLAAIGVRISGGVTTHGFALNVSTDLSAYGGIVPCGLRDAEVTSLANLLPATPSMDDVKAAIVEAFLEVFGFTRANP